MKKSLTYLLYLPLLLTGCMTLDQDTRIINKLRKKPYELISITKLPHALEIIVQREQTIEFITHSDTDHDGDYDKTTTKTLDRKFRILKRFKTLPAKYPDPQT